VRVDRNEDSEGDPFGSDDEEFMEAARAARASTGWDREAEVEYTGALSPEDSARVLGRIRALEEKARDIVGEISALKTYFLHWGEMPIDIRFTIDLICSDLFGVYDI
jgi:hypothetical protein